MMCRLLMLAATISIFLPSGFAVHAGEQAEALDVAATDWPWWRGPTRDGVAAPGQAPPLQWSEDKNVLWKVPVPGRGHGSPTVVGDRIFLATADEAAEIQSVICFDRNTGAQRWKTDVHRGGFASAGRQGHIRASKASSTVASDGQRIFINFINDNAVYLTALSLDGEQLWQRKVSDYVMHQGYGASPALYGPLAIAAVDHHGGGALSAFDRVTGEPAWTHRRPENPNYTSPIILGIGGRDQLILTGCDLVSSFDPLTGAVNWEAEGATTECVTSTVTDGEHVVTSGGYPSKHISVMRADGSGAVRWRNDTLVYVPSLLIREGHLYAVNDNGDAICYELETGTVAWEHRLRAKFAASPVLVGDMIFAIADDGTTHIFKADPAGFAPVAENILPADEVQATPAICGNRIYLRLALGKDAARQEFLYCLGE